MPRSRSLVSTVVWSTLRVFADSCTVRVVAPVLAEPAVAAAVLAETIGAGSDGAAALGVVR
jgi:hypothetical protein